MNYILIVAVVIGACSIGLIFWALFAFEAFKKELAAELLATKAMTDIKTRPMMIEQYRRTPDRKTLAQYYRLLDEFDSAAASGRGPATSIELNQIRISLGSLYQPLYKSEHGMRSIAMGCAVFLILPLSFWVLILFALVWAVGQGVTNKNLIRFEQLVNAHYKEALRVS